MQALKGLVIGLGLTIALVVGVMVWGLFKKSEDPDFKMFTFSSAEKDAEPARQAADTSRPTPPAPTGPVPAWGTISLNLPAGCAIVDMESRPGRLFVRSAATGPTVSGCARVTLIDPNTGRILGTVVGGP